jgi:uncharacterized damage-inducible protein DinB
MKPPSREPVQQLSDIYMLNERLNQLVIEHLDPAAWRVKVPGSRTRTIAAIFSHMHNIRCKWVRLSAPHLKVPAPLNRNTCKQKEASAALAASALRCSEMLAHASAGRVTHFHRDGWAKPWRTGPAMLAYMLAHDAHHRGQVCMLAHQFGFKLPIHAAHGIWNWEKLWRESGFHPPL